eukprot:jgi/Orpsp1_1/1178940/evm.model.c7180000067323.1
MKGDRWVDIPAYTEIPECLAFMDNLLQVKLNENWCIISDMNLIFYKYYGMFDKKEVVINCSLKDQELNRKLVNAIEKGHTFILLLYEKDINEIPPFIKKLITTKYFQNEYKKSKHVFSFSGVAENVVISPNFRLHLVVTKPIELINPEIIRFLEPIYIDTPEEFITNILVDCYFNRFEPGFNKKRKDNTKQITDLFSSIGKNIESMYEIINDIEKKNLYTGPVYENINKKNNEYDELNKSYDEQIKIKLEYNKKVKWITELCKHGSWMFQLMNKFSTVNPLYQFNLYNYIELITNTFTECPLDDNKALQESRSLITKAIYNNVSLVLHDYDRVVFSFIISLTNVFYKKVDEYSISEKLWSYFLNKDDYTNYEINSDNIKDDKSNKVIVRPNSIYSDGTDLDLIASKYNEVEKNIPWITKEKWNLILNLSKIDQFSKVPFDILKSLNMMSNRSDIATWDTVMNYDCNTIKIPPKIDSNLKTFEKILLSYYIRPYSLYQNLDKYIESVLGDEFTDINLNIFETAYSDSNHHRPIIIFVNCNENNVDFYMRTFVNRKGMSNKYKHLIFNNNMDEINGSIDEAMNIGNWILLSNCERNIEWFKNFEEKLTFFQCHPGCKISHNFRLWIIFNKNETNRQIDISKQLPFSYIQNCIKIMIENTNDFRFQFNEALSLFDDMFNPNNIASVGTYQQALYKICIFYTVVSLSAECGSLIFNNNLLFKLNDLKVAGRQLYEIYSTYFRSSGNMKTIQKLIRGMILNKNLKAQNSIVEDVEIIKSYFDDIMNLTWKTQNGNNNMKNYLAAKISPMIINILNQDLQAVFDSLQSHDINKVQSIIFSMSKKKNQPPCFGLGNYLRREKSKYQSINIIDTIKTLYIEDISNKCQFLWTKYDKIKNILLFYKNKLNEELKNTIFNSEKNLLDDLEKSIKITRYLNYVLLDSVKHYYKLLEIVYEYFNKGLEESFILSSDYNTFAETIIHNILPKEFKAKNRGYPTQLKLNTWIDDFISRMLFIQSWYEREKYQNPLIVYDLSKIFNPGLFIIAILQDYARQTHSLYENVKFDIMLISVEQTKAPDRGIYIKGLKLVGANWDYSRGILTDNQPYETVNTIPCIWLQPHVKFNNNDFTEIEPTNTTSQFQRYQCPVYSYICKKGFNDEFDYNDLYITTLELSIENTITYWTEKNVCMICEYNYEEDEYNILKLGENNSNQ